MGGTGGTGGADPESLRVADSRRLLELSQLSVSPTQLWENAPLTSSCCED